MLARRWKGRPRGLSELPVEIRTSPLYENPGQDYWLDRADQSLDGAWYRLRFEGGMVHYWYASAVDGAWKFSPVPPQFAAGEESAPVPDAHLVPVAAAAPEPDTGDDDDGQI